MQDDVNATISEDERGLAVIAHLSGLAGYIIPLGGILVPIVIWVVKSDSRVISNIAKQAIILNVIVFILGFALLGLFLTVILIPVAFLGWIVLGIVAVVPPIVGAIRASDGLYYAYPLIGVQP
jgi:uncharacterized Tic20 family protein